MCYDGGIYRAVAIACLNVIEEKIVASGAGHLVAPLGDVAASHLDGVAGERTVDGSVVAVRLKRAEVDGVGVWDGESRDGGGGHEDGGEDAGELHFEVWWLIEGIEEWLVNWC
jgi:hypothetical protein